MDINQLIANHGACFYVVAFVWTFLEGETFILFAAFAAAHGLIDPWVLLIAAWLGGFSGDQFYFWIARHYGVTLLDRFPRWRHRVEAPLHFLERVALFEGLPDPDDLLHGEDVVVVVVVR